MKRNSNKKLRILLFTMLMLSFTACTDDEQSQRYKKEDYSVIFTRDVEGPPQVEGIFDFSQLTLDLTQAQIYKIRSLYLELCVSPIFTKILILLYRYRPSRTILKIENINASGRYLPGKSTIILNENSLEDVLPLKEELIHAAQEQFYSMYDPYYAIKHNYNMELEAHLIIDAIYMLEERNKPIEKSLAFSHTRGLSSTPEFDNNLRNFLNVIYLEGGYYDEAEVYGQKMYSIYNKLGEGWSQSYEGTFNHAVSPDFMKTFVGR